MPAGLMHTRRLCEGLLPGLLLCLLQVVAGCQLWQPAQPRGQWLAVAAPAEFGRAVQVTQMFTGHYRSRDMAMPLTMPVELAISHDRMTLVGFSHIGGALFSATLAQGQIVHTASPALPPGWEPAVLLQEVQLALWPLSQLQAHLLQPDITVVQQGRERVLQYRGQPFIRIRYSADDPLTGSIQFEQLAQDYRWTLETLPP